MLQIQFFSMLILKHNGLVTQSTRLACMWWRENFDRFYTQKQVLWIFWTVRMFLYQQQIHCITVKIKLPAQKPTRGKCVVLVMLANICK